MHMEISLQKMRAWHQEGRFSRDPVLQRGHRGTKVRELQTLLNKWGVTPPPQLVVDGDFGDNTLNKVVAFQTAKALLVDGVVGKDTWAALHAL